MQLLGYGRNLFFLFFLVECEVDWGIGSQRIEIEDHFCYFFVLDAVFE